MDLREAPQYDALSYVWGPTTPPKTLRIEGRNISIPIIPNLHAALHALCSDNSLQYLWVDAVCINQMDMEEKEYQVAMMADIYISAATVRIYLGKSLLKRPGLLGYWNRMPTLLGEPLDEITARLEIQIPDILNDYLDFIF